MTITYKKLIEYVLSDEYSQKVYSIIEERAHRLIQDDGCDDERKYTHWEQNPFCVEDQLIGDSSGYYEDDDAFDRAFEDAKETVSEDCCDELTEPETISKFLEECSKDDENWVFQLIDYVIDQQ